MLSLHLKIPPLPESPPSPPGWETPGKGERGRAPLRPWGGGGVGYYIKASTGHPHWESQPLVTPGRDGDTGCVAHPARPGTPAGEWSGPHCHSGTGGRGGGVGGGLRPPEFPPSWEESEVGGGDFVAPPPGTSIAGGDTYRHGVPRHMEALKARGSAAPKRTPGVGRGHQKAQGGVWSSAPPKLSAAQKAELGARRSPQDHWDPHLGVAPCRAASPHIGQRLWGPGSPKRQWKAAAA